uniref:Protein-tyrosine-phosphatase n=1 Tax=Angiostrongylus cantonensis TaxID=6313 RepID=A0A0K0CVD7_ANGCA
MPVRLPRRAEMKVAYKHDPPLSEIGRIMTQIFARELVVRNAIPKVIYSSTSFASIQTAADIQSFIGAFKMWFFRKRRIIHLCPTSFENVNTTFIRGLYGEEIEDEQILSFLRKECGSICVDPSLASDRQAAPFWLTQKEMLQLKYHINESYIPQKVEGEDLNSIASSMKRLINTFSQRTGLESYVFCYCNFGFPSERETISVLVVMDSLAVSMLMNIVSGAETKYDQSEKQLRKEAEIAFPATSSIIFAPNDSVSTQLFDIP